MTPPSWVLVPNEIDTWLDDVNELAPCHGRFPIGSRPSTLASSRSIPSWTRVDYLRALRRADSGDLGFLGEILARAVLDNLYEFIVPAVAGPRSAAASKRRKGLMGSGGVAATGSTTTSRLARAGR